MATRYDPFAELTAIMNSSLRQGPTSPVMPLDLYREGDTFVASVDLPGVDPTSIDIDVEDRTLTIRAERRAHTSEGMQWISHERPTGTFARQMTLGYGLDLGHVVANYADGVLTLTIPVAEEAKPRKIQVSHTGSSAEIESGTEA
jgi:HSP20 family protein